MAPHPTIALREPANYGLRGWISTRSSDLAQVLSGWFPWGISGRPFVRADRAAFPATRRECFGDLSRERERHEDVEGPDGPAFAGISGGRPGACHRRDGIRRIGAAGAVGVQAAGSRLPGDGEHHLVP